MRSPILVEAKANARWSLDFMHDQMAMSKKQSAEYQREQKALNVSIYIGAEGQATLGVGVSQSFGAFLKPFKYDAGFFETTSMRFGEQSGASGFVGVQFGNMNGVGYSVSGNTGFAGGSVTMGNNGNLNGASVILH